MFASFPIICLLVNLLKIDAFTSFTHAVVKPHRIVTKHLMTQFSAQSRYRSKSLDSSLGESDAPIIPRVAVLDPSQVLLPDGGLPGAALVVGLSALLGSVFLFQMATGAAIIPSYVFSLYDLKSSLTMALILSVPLCIGGIVLSVTPSDFVQKVRSSNRVFALRTIGKDTSPAMAAVTVYGLSLFSAVAEETFFRGFVFTLLQQYSNFNFAVAASSLLFGIAHYPLLLGAGSALEVILGIFIY
jgi:membrane protease YdiL (CAAX protease family)